MTKGQPPPRSDCQSNRLIHSDGRMTNGQRALDCTRLWSFIISQKWLPDSHLAAVFPHSAWPLSSQTIICSVPCQGHTKAKAETSSLEEERMRHRWTELSSWPGSASREKPGMGAPPQPQHLPPNLGFLLQSPGAEDCGGRCSRQKRACTGQGVCV